MTSNILLRIVAFLLVSCLMADASRAMTPLSYETAQVPVHSMACQQLFQEEAFLEPALWVLQSLAKKLSANEKHQAGSMELLPARLPGLVLSSTLKEGSVSPTDSEKASRASKRSVWSDDDKIHLFTRYIRFKDSDDQMVRNELVFVAQDQALEPDIQVGLVRTSLIGPPGVPITYHSKWIILNTAGDRLIGEIDVHHQISQDGKHFVGNPYMPAGRLKVGGQAYMQRAITLALLTGQIEAWYSSEHWKPRGDAERMYERLGQDSRLHVVRHGERFIVTRGAPSISTMPSLMGIGVPVIQRTHRHNRPFAKRMNGNYETFNAAELAGMMWPDSYDEDHRPGAANPLDLSKGAKHQSGGQQSLTLLHDYTRAQTVPVDRESIFKQIAQRFGAQYLGEEIFSIYQKTVYSFGFGDNAKVDVNVYGDHVQLAPQNAYRRGELVSGIGLPMAMELGLPLQSSCIRWLSRDALHLWRELEHKGIARVDRALQIFVADPKAIAILAEAA